MYEMNPENFITEILGNSVAIMSGSVNRKQILQLRVELLPSRIYLHTVLLVKYPVTWRNVQLSLYRQFYLFSDVLEENRWDEPSESWQVLITFYFGAQILLSNSSPSSTAQSKSDKELTLFSPVRTTTRRRTRTRRTPTKIYQNKVYYRLGIWNKDLTHRIKTAHTI